MQKRNLQDRGAGLLFATMKQHGPSFAASRTRLALVTPLRLALGVAVLVGSLAEGAVGDSALASFALGGAFAAFAIVGDRRGLLRGDAPESLPHDARLAAPWRAALDAAMPSTVGVAVLAVIALAIGQEVLAALLGGVEAGMALAGAIAFVRVVEWERREGARLMVEVGPRGRVWVLPEERSQSADAVG
jgi:hypothetical protein